ncbi:hypothetical protein EHQ05_13610 [Leptospira yasudae]|uniref:Lipoprotein n=1 Tax=Leptospira yasudae TaxID=2202201 RepID=A0ABX9M2Y7_9LEPT|nr:hypothetical protein [Leptospira yasudae]RHX79966.1 hypothetical protein DLM77_08780 [Leptospira yasudae]TGK25902.1 hypothetical protein EHQ05_13610 [Leptospira yasudae]TGM03001.1 hypothetical protein EHQ86_18325 [Leptospira yasudae]
MKHTNFRIFKISFLSLTQWMMLLFLLNCGVTGFTNEHSVVRVPVKTETEVFHANLLHGEVKNLYGLNLGIVNIIKERLIGFQVGGANVSEGKTYGAQVGVIYNSAKKGGFTVQAGIANKVEDGGAGVQVGIYNKGENKGLFITAGAYNRGGSGASVGLINDEGFGLNVGGFNYGYGVNVGVINSGKGLSIGALNIGEDGNLQIGILNFCTEGPFPIMIVLNYCSKPAETIEPKPATTKVDTKIAPANK